MVSTEGRREQESVLCSNYSSKEQSPYFRSLEEANSLAEDNMNLVRHTISIYYPSISTSDEDAFQEGMIGLIAASRKYDNSLGAFSTFAIKCIRNQLNYYLNSVNRCCFLDDKYVSLDADNENSISNAETFLGDSDVDYYNLIQSEFISQLPKGQSNIVKLSIQGNSQAAIARKIGYSKQYVSKQMKIIRKKFNTYILDKAS